MMIIRRPQIDDMQKSINTCFTERALPQIKAAWPDCLEAISDATLWHRMELALLRAQSYQLKLDNDLIAFIQLTLLLGYKFDLYGPLGQFLSSKEIADEERMSELFNATSDLDWINAAAFCAEGDFEWEKDRDL